MGRVVDGIFEALRPGVVLSARGTLKAIFLWRRQPPPFDLLARAIDDQVLAELSRTRSRSSSSVGGRNGGRSRGPRPRPSCLNSRNVAARSIPWRAMLETPRRARAVKVSVRSPANLVLLSRLRLRCEPGDDVGRAAASGPCRSLNAERSSDDWCDKNLIRGSGAAYGCPARG